MGRHKGIPSQNKSRNKTFFCLFDYIYYRGERITQRYESIWRGGGSIIFLSLYIWSFSFIANPFYNPILFFLGFGGVIILEILRYNVFLKREILFSHYKRNKWNRRIPDWAVLAFSILLLITALWFPVFKYD